MTLMTLMTRWTLLAAALVAVALAPAAAGAAGPCGTRAWCDAALSPDARATLLEDAMSQSDRVAMLTGGSAPDVGVRKLLFVDGAMGAGTDGGLGVAQDGLVPATAMPASIALAASFDPAMAERYGAVVGAEVRHRGFDGDYGPTVNIMRTPLGGRTYEGYGEDPFLDARTAVGWIQGAQGAGVMVSVKHFAENNQEGQGGASPGDGANGGRLNVNVIVDDRTLHEIELPAFAAAVEQGDVAAVMCAYNQVNGSYACDNPSLLQRVLRGQLGFGGIILSDAGAAHSPPADLDAGLDYDIVGNSDNPVAVDLALADGQVSRTILDARVHEYLRTLFAYGFFDRTGLRAGRSARAASTCWSARPPVTFRCTRRSRRVARPAARPGSRSRSAAPRPRVDSPGSRSAR